MADMTWDEAVQEVYAKAETMTADELLHRIEELCRQLPPGDPRVPSERGSALDVLGRESEAIPLYREALDRGLEGVSRERVTVQLASSLRNVGQAQEAVELLRGTEFSSALGGAPEAFRALALYSAGRSSEALAVALRALAATLPEYGGAVARYAEDLPADRADPRTASGSAKDPRRQQ